MFNSDQFFADIGAELKNSAMRTYKIGMIVEIVILIGACLAGLFFLVDDDIELGLVLIGGGFVEFFAAMGILHWVTTARYAKGEMVHLLMGIRYNTRKVVAVPTTEPDKAAAPAPVTAPVKPVTPAKPAMQTIPARKDAPAVRLPENKPVDTVQLGRTQKVEGAATGKGSLKEILAFAMKYSSESGMRNYLSSAMNREENAAYKEELKAVLAVPDEKLRDTAMQILNNT